MTNLDFPDWSEARSFAEEIAQFGAPLLRLTANLGKNAAGLNIPANSVIDLFPLTNINQPGYELVIGLDSAVNSLTNPFALLTIQWVDSVSGIQLAGDEFMLGAGNANPSALFYYVSGPCKADQVKMSVENFDGAASMVCRYTANVNSHFYTWDRVFQTQYIGSPPHGFTQSGGAPQFGVIAMRQPLIGPGATDATLMAVYNGKVALHVNNVLNANSLYVTLQDPGSLYSSGVGTSVFASIVAVGASLDTTLTLPNGPVSLNIKNNGGAGNVQPDVSVIRQDY